MRIIVRRVLAASLAVAVTATLGGGDRGRPDPPRSGASIVGLDRLPTPPSGSSWAPRPALVAGLRTLARAADAALALSTAHGPVGFLAGVNLGSTTPGHQPGELAISAPQYRDWFEAMGRLGVRVVRLYTIHPPDCYQELRQYNGAHPDAPLYLVQGVYLPDESYLAGDLYAPGPTAAFSQELRDAVAAVHGGLTRRGRPGHAAGTWRADVSGWLAAWIIGVEWDPEAIAASDARNASQPSFTGRYFTSRADASPTERWLAARMDELATGEASHGDSPPIAFANWPTTDPLRHPDEPLPDEDLAGVDANHVQATAAWPGGQFASYHAYPYYPDFQRHQPGLTRYSYAGRSDPYAGYLAALRRHHAEAGIPVMISEFGVPAAIGSAHAGPLGRDQGGHGEREAMRIDAELLRLIKDAGLCGGLVFAWADEWFKRTWNTMTHQVPAGRRQLWHDQLTNEQWFGLLAMDPTGVANPDRQVLPATGPIADATARVDEAYLYLDIRFTHRPEGALGVALDPVPALAGSPGPYSTDRDADVVLVLDPAADTGQEWVRTQVDPVPLDYPVPAGARPAPSDGWVPLQLVTNRPLTVPSTGQALPMEFVDVGRLRRGDWDPAAAGYDSRATWRITGSRLRVRLPWAMAGIADPSSHRALLPGATDNVVVIPGIAVSVTVAGRTASLGTVTWQDWQRVGYRARLKSGVEVLRDAFSAVA